MSEVTKPFGIQVVSWIFLMMVLCPIVVSCSHDRRQQLDTMEPPSNEFKKHSIIEPKIFHGREKRRISSTLEKENSHIQYLTLIYNLDGKKYILDLRLNKELIPKDSFIKYQSQGKNVINNITEQNVDLCQYVGHVRGISKSWVALSTCRGLRGVIYDGNSSHYLQPGNSISSIEAPHFLYKHEDLNTNLSGGYEDSFSSLNKQHKRSVRNPDNLIRGPIYENKHSLYVEYILVVNNEAFRKFGGDLNYIHQHCRDIANIINQLYTPLNIFIALVGVVVWSEKDEIQMTGNGENVLKDFLEYRRRELVKDHPNDNAQLLIGNELDGGVLGKAIKGLMCTLEKSGGIIVDHSNIVALIGTTAAHELGHNFGMEHDNEYCNCPDKVCIMNPSTTSKTPNKWSSCSLEYLALTIRQGMDFCLRNKPKWLFESPTCGNGFVEPGEECDCGMSKIFTGNYCCNPETCMLYPNATCATGKCCDLQTCQLSVAGKLCRNAENECDLPEFCTGQSEYCPDDVFKIDTEICDKGNAFCYQGYCKTRFNQCQLLWGPSANNSNKFCYNFNMRGNREGNCGYDKFNQVFSKCSNENIMCGRLHCIHLNERLEFGSESSSILSHSFQNIGGEIISCRAAVVDLGTNVDPGMVPNGAKCGNGMMCYNQKCLPVDTIRMQIQRSGKSVACSSNCSGHGVCNSLGHCHCDEGFGPPLCDIAGSGGSVDSGPANLNASTHTTLIVCLILLGILCLVIIIFILKCYKSKNILTCWKQSETMTYVKGNISCEKCCALNCFGDSHINKDTNTMNSNNTSTTQSNINNKNKNSETETHFEFHEKSKKPKIEKKSFISTTNEYVHDNFALYKSRVLSIRRSSLFVNSERKQSLKRDNSNNGSTFANRNKEPTFEKPSTSNDKGPTFEKATASSNNYNQPTTSSNAISVNLTNEIKLKSKQLRTNKNGNSFSIA